MNKKKLWFLKKLFQYSVNPQWKGTPKNFTSFQNISNIKSLNVNKLLREENIKRLMGSDSKSKKHEGHGRHCFHKETQKILNDQAVEEYIAAFEYLSMALYFGRTDLALPGCQGFFMNMYEEELGHGNIFVNYVLMRGGSVCLTDIKVPKTTEYTIKKAFKRATKMEMHIKEKLIAVYDVAEKHKDLQIMDMVSTDFMEEQNRSICEMARLCTRAKIVDTPVGEHLFDQFIFKSFVKTKNDNLMNKRKLELETSKFDIYK